jgi:hypothetical protein
LARYLIVDHPLSSETRRHHIEELIRLLETHNWFQVGLTDVTTALEVEIKSSLAVMLRGIPTFHRADAMRGEVILTPTRGPSYIYIEEAKAAGDEKSADDAQSVIFSFLVEFERHWDSLPPEHREKEHVVRFLRDVVLSPDKNRSIIRPDKRGGRSRH